MRGICASLSPLARSLDFFCLNAPAHTTWGTFPPSSATQLQFKVIHVYSSRHCGDSGATASWGRHTQSSQWNISHLELHTQEFPEQHSDSCTSSHQGPPQGPTWEPIKKPSETEVEDVHCHPKIPALFRSRNNETNGYGRNTCVEDAGQ